MGISLLVLLLIPAGIFFTVRLRFPQIRLFPDMIRAVTEKNDHSVKGSISGFQTLIIATATRVGMGNLVGVVAAISAGGAGAVFWMWITAILGSATAFVEATLAPCIMCNNENNVGKDIRSPLPTITTGNRNFVAAPILIQYHTETTQNETRGQGIEDPLMTVDGSNRYGLVTSFISKFYKSGTGQDIREPLHTVTTSPGHFGEVRAFLTKYYGAGTGQDIKAPLDTITAQDRFGLVTIYGTEYQIVDIGLRMLEPKELYGCQGFPDDYIIDRDCDGKPYPRAEQVRRCGNAVCPPIPTALVRANLKELCVAKRLPNCRADRLGEDASGQLRFA